MPPANNSAEPPPAAPDPYDFLRPTAGPPKGPRGWLANAGPKKLLISALALVGGLGLVAATAALIFGSGPSNKQQLIDIAAEQNELIRIAEIGTTKSRGTTAKNLAFTAKYTLTTDQQPLLNALKKQRAKPTNRQLASGRNPRTDELLTAAEQANRFDEVFIKTLQEKLQAYQRQLKAAYDNPASGPKLKATLAQQYKNAVQLINVKPEI